MSNYGLTYKLTTCNLNLRFEICNNFHIHGSFKVNTVLLRICLLRKKKQFPNIIPPKQMQNSLIYLLQMPEPHLFKYSFTHYYCASCTPSHVQLGKYNPHLMCVQVLLVKSDTMMSTIL